MDEKPKRRVGRPPGRKNKATIEREMLNHRRDAEQHRDPRTAIRKLSKEYLEDFTHVCAGYAAQYQPREGNPLADKAQFEFWMGWLLKFAAESARYQSPTFKAIAVVGTQGGSGSGGPPLIDLTAERIDANEASRAYKMIMDGKAA